MVAFGGAILGSALVYIFPALMFLKHKRDAKEPQVREVGLATPNPTPTPNPNPNPNIRPYPYPSP